MSSILNDVKHMLGLLESDTAFDQDIIHYINGAFGTLTQLGVGPAIGFQITDESKTWDDYLTDPRLNSVKSFIFLTCKIQFDPPATGFVLASMERQIKELEFRLNVVADYG